MDAEILEALRDIRFDIRDNEPIKTHLGTIAICLLAQQGVGRVVMAQNGELTLEPLPEPEAPGPFDGTRRAGITKTHPGTSVWVMYPPPPHNTTDFECALDAESPVGFRCQAIVKGIGGRRDRYDVTFTLRPPLR